MLLFIIGLASGIISGMGIGGGAILIPALVLLVNPGQQKAQSVNLIFFIPTAVVALIIHIRKKRVDFRMALPIIISGLAGAYLGSSFAVALPGLMLKKWFGAFLLAMGCYEMVRKGSGGKSGKEAGTPGNYEKEAR
jgi:uncharacterized membrane protein YfcA